MDGILSSKLFATRQGTIVLGVIAAVIAAVALIVYLHSYRNSVNNNGLSPVLTAKGLIQKGTAGDVIASNGLSTDKPWQRADIKTGALVDPAALTGEVALRDIYPGQQLTADDFGPATNSIAEQLNPKERAITVALDSAPQVGGQIAAGSHVDVWSTGTPVGTNTVPLAFLLVQDVYVLNVNGSNVTLRTTSQQAGLIIYAQANDKIYLALRPTVATNSPTKPVRG